MRMAEELSRTVPAPVRRLLRREVGFGCPVPDCRLPFLEYHHFDPEWHVEHHHRPDGLIPLCPTHHSQADAFTREQLRNFKSTAKDRVVASGRFEWMRRELVGVVGGCLYHEVPVLVQFRGEPMVWFERDDDGHALLNVRMLTTVGNEQERIRIEDNDFVVRGAPTDFECPPSGKSLSVKYDNGDRMRIEFREIDSVDEAAGRYSHFRPGAMAMLGSAWPLTFIEVTMRAGGTEVAFDPTMTRLPGNNLMTGCVASHGAVGLAFD